MQFVTNCVRPARVFVFRLWNRLVSMKGDVEVVDQEMYQDLVWWKEYLPRYNGVSIMWMTQALKVNKKISSDAYLTGIGGYCEKLFFHARVPIPFDNSEKYKIHHLEMLAVLVSLRVWATVLTGYRFVMGCNNQAVVEVVNGGSSLDRILQGMLRDLAYLPSCNEFEVILQYVPTEKNKISDVLS